MNIKVKKILTHTEKRVYLFAFQNMFLNLRKGFDYFSSIACQREVM